MTTTELRKAIETSRDGRVHIESGRGEDHDTGWAYITDDSIVVAWDSGVKTPFTPDNTTSIL